MTKMTHFEDEIAKWDEAVLSQNSLVVERFFCQFEDVISDKFTDELIKSAYLITCMSCKSFKQHFCVCEKKITVLCCNFTR